MDDYNGLHSSGCTLSFAGSSEREWKVPWRIGDTREYSYIIKLHESADVPFLEWEWHPDSNLTVTDGIARTAPRSQYSNPYVYFGIRDLLEPDSSGHSVIAKQVFDNLYKDPAEGKLEEDIWLKVDKGPAVKIAKNMHSISTVNAKLSLRENNYIYSNSLLKFLYLNPKVFY